MEPADEEDTEAPGREPEESGALGATDGATSGDTPAAWIRHDTARPRPPTPPPANDVLEAVVAFVDDLVVDGADGTEGPRGEADATEAEADEEGGDGDPAPTP